MKNKTDIKKINIDEKISLFKEYWNPKIIGELNGQHVKLAKLKGEFIWHKHDNEDEMFYVLKGCLKIEFEDYTKEINENEIIIIPRGINHKPVAEKEVIIMLFEPASTINTGEFKNKLTRNNLEKI